MQLQEHLDSEIAIMRVFGPQFRNTAFRAARTTVEKEQKRQRRKTTEMKRNCVDRFVDGELLEWQVKTPHRNVIRTFEGSDMFTFAFL